MIIQPQGVSKGFARQLESKRSTLRRIKNIIH